MIIHNTPGSEKLRSKFKWSKGKRNTLNRLNDDRKPLAVVVVDGETNITEGVDDKVRQAPRRDPALPRQVLWTPKDAVRTVAIFRQTHKLEWDPVKKPWNGQTPKPRPAASPKFYNWQEMNISKTPPQGEGLPRGSPLRPVPFFTIFPLPLLHTARVTLQSSGSTVNAVNLSPSPTTARSLSSLRLAQISPGTTSRRSSLTTCRSPSPSTARLLSPTSEPPRGTRLPTCLPSVRPTSNAFFKRFMQSLQNEKVPVVTCGGVDICYYLMCQFVRTQFLPKGFNSSEWYPPMVHNMDNQTLHNGVRLQKYHRNFSDHMVVLSLFPKKLKITNLLDSFEYEAATLETRHCRCVARFEEPITTKEIWIAGLSISVCTVCSIDRRNAEIVYKTINIPRNILCDVPPAWVNSDKVTITPPIQFTEIGVPAQIRLRNKGTTTLCIVVTGRNHDIEPNKLEIGGEEPASIELIRTGSGLAGRADKAGRAHDVINFWVEDQENAEQQHLCAILTPQK